MIEKESTDFSWVTYLWVIGISCWGGTASYLRGMAHNKPLLWHLGRLGVELTSCSLAGFITFYLSEFGHIDKLLEVPLVAISGHMGSRALFLMERLYKRRLALPEEDQDAAE